MNELRQARGTEPALIAVSAALLAAGALLVVLAALNTDLLDPRALPLALVPVLAGAVAAAGWGRSRAVARRLVGADERANERLAHERELHEQETQRLIRERDEERSERRRTAHERDVEHAWNKRLRERIVELQRRQGLLSDTRDVRALVLRIAIELLGAEKGLLLAREDADSDGDLDLVAYEGFEHDPEHSAVAQHFAREVLARDRTVRMDDPPPGAPQTEADREIENLVAIPIYISDDFSGVVVCANKRGGFHDHDDEVLLALGDHAGAVLHNARLQGDLRNSYLATVRLLGEAIEANDPSLAGHSEDVSGYVAAVAEGLEIDPSRREALVFASLLHDVGKIGISERILLKPGPLTREERSVVELHPRIGYHLVEQVPALRQIAPAILHHHERFDGEGYPGGLKGDEIPLEARIIAVVDSFSAMTSRRPYREAVSRDEACAELERCAGTQFDPEIVRLFCEQVRERPPSEAPLGRNSLDTDPELKVRRDHEEEAVFGSASYALVDNLTLLYSRRYLHELARAEASRAAVQKRPFAIVFAELTELERINRDEGYAEGDETIRALAHAADELAGRMGGTACRCSGRRVSIVLPDSDEARAADAARELEDALGDGLAIETSIAAWTEGDSGDDVVDRAREALRASTPA